MSLSQVSVAQFYQNIIDDTMASCQHLLSEEGLDEGVLHEMKALWQTKLRQSRALPGPDPDVANGAGGDACAAAPGTLAAPAAAAAAAAVPRVPPRPPPHALEAAAAAVRWVPIQITLPQARVVHIHVPHAALLHNRLHRLLSAPVIQATAGLSPAQAGHLLQQHIYASQANSLFTANNVIHQLDGHASDLDESQQQYPLGEAAARLRNDELLERAMLQVDGGGDSSDDQLLDIASEDASVDTDVGDDDSDGDADAAVLIDEEPLNSGDDMSETDSLDTFACDNVLVCQYDKVQRSRNKWRFVFKDGIMNLNGKDFIFQRTTGEADW